VGCKLEIDFFQRGAIHSNPAAQDRGAIRSGPIHTSTAAASASPLTEGALTLDPVSLLPNTGRLIAQGY